MQREGHDLILLAPDEEDGQAQSADTGEIGLPAAQQAGAQRREERTPEAEVAHLRAVTCLVLRQRRMLRAQIIAQPADERPPPEKAHQQLPQHGDEEQPRPQR